MSQTRQNVLAFYRTAKNNEKETDSRDRSWTKDLDSRICPRHGAAGIASREMLEKIS